jgi:hypothetical protein
MKNKFLTTVEMVISQLKDSNYACLVCSKKNKFKECTHWYPTIYKSAPAAFELGSYEFLDLDSNEAKKIISKHLQMQNIVVVSVPPNEYFIGSEELKKVRSYKFDISGNYLHIYENGLVIQIVELSQEYLNKKIYNQDCNVHILMLQVQNSGNFTRDLGIELALYLHDKNFDFDLGTLIYQIELDEIEFVLTAQKFDLPKRYHTSLADKTELLINKFGYCRSYDFDDESISSMKKFAKAKANNLLMSRGRIFYNPFNEKIAHYDYELI